MINTERPQSNDAELIEGSKHGDDHAFRELMERYIAPIFNFSRQYSKAEEDAEDITQDTFFKVWRHMKKFDTKKPFKPWLYAIARNTALDHIKKKRASAFSELDNDDADLHFADTLEDGTPLQTELFENGELVAEVAEAMDDLHPDHRAVLVMRYREEMSFNEIADIMDKPMNTVKSWHHRALGKIRPRLMHRKS